MYAKTPLDPRVYCATHKMRGANEQAVCDNEKERKHQLHHLTPLSKLTRLIALTSCLSVPHVFWFGGFF